MVMSHYGGRSYDEAASDAAYKCRELLESKIEAGRVSGQRILDKVMTEVPKDQIVRGRVLEFDGDVDGRPSGSPSGLLLDSPSTMTLHKHALSQICSRAGFPQRYSTFLQEGPRAGWGTQLLAENLNTLYSHANESKFLLRGHDSQLRGFLSDKYRRLDSRPLLEAFAGASQEFGAIPIEGYGTDTKVAVKALLPAVFEPVPNEVMAFGVMWENSDYGNGKHRLMGFIERLWCTNYAIMTETFAQVHLGKRLSEDITFSEETYQLDTKAQASAIKDIVRQLISPEAVEGYCEIVRKANAMKIEPKMVLGTLQKSLTKTEVEEVAAKYNEPDVVELPAGNSVWRMSNAISWVAGNVIEDTERKVEVMKVAGKVLERAA